MNLERKEKNIQTNKEMKEERYDERSLYAE